MKLILIVNVDSLFWQKKIIISNRANEFSNECSFLGLIKLPQKVQFTPSIQPVRLPATCKIADNTDVIAMGNGVTSADSNISRKLRFTQLKTMSINSCRYEFPIVLLRTSVICAKDKDQSASAVCFGDSGSPLVTVDGTLVGVTSFGRPGRL